MDIRDIAVVQFLHPSGEMRLRAARAVGKVGGMRRNILGLRRLRSIVGRYVREMALAFSIVGRRNDHPTLLVMPSHGRDDGASNLRGYLIARHLRSHGWNAYTCDPNLGLGQRRRIIKRLRPDVILMQMARHPLNRPGLYPVPVVFDIDDADYLDPAQEAIVVEALQRSAAVIAGSRAVAEFCDLHNSNVHVVWTGAPVSGGILRPQALRERVVSWAALYPNRCPEEAEFVLDVLARLSAMNIDFKFILYCDDGSEDYRKFADRFRSLGISVTTKPRIERYSDFLGTLDDVAVGLAPLVNMRGFSSGKSFGKVLAYMDRGVPVLTHPVVDHPLFFKNGINGYLMDSPGEWALAIAKLLADPAERQRLADEARVDLWKRLSTQEAALRVEAVLKEIIGKSGVV